MSQVISQTSSGGGGGSSIDTLTGNSGGAVPPTTNNINILGTGSIVVTGNIGNSTLTISNNAGSILSYTATAISYQVLITDATIGVTSTAAARTITMPLAGMTAGQIWTVKDESGLASVNNITIAGNAANIDGAAFFSINNNYGAVNIYWNGTAFFIT